MFYKDVTHISEECFVQFNQLFYFGVFEFIFVHLICMANGLLWQCIDRRKKKKQKRKQWCYMHKMHLTFILYMLWGKQWFPWNGQCLRKLSTNISTFEICCFFLKSVNWPKSVQKMEFYYISADMLKYCFAN